MTVKISRGRKGAGCRRGRDKPTRTRSGQYGITRKIRDRIIRAARLTARGLTIPEVAKILDAKYSAIRDMQFRHPDVWESALNAATRDNVETVRQMAGTDAVLENPDTFVLMAGHCERLTAQRGEELFPRDGLTLTRFYEDYYRPTRMGRASPHTVYTDRGFLKRWRLLTGDPLLSEITPIVLGRFRDALASMQGLRTIRRMTSRSIRAYVCRIQTFIDKAGPPGFHNRDAAGILEKSPWVKPPPKEFNPPKIVTHETLSEVYRLAFNAEVPKVDKFKPSAWWRSLLVVSFNTGLRPRALFALRMRDIDWAGAALIVPHSSMKTKIGQRIPLNDVALDHLRKIRTDRELVFPWPFGPRYFDVCFHRLQAAAGIPPEQHFGLHTIRRTLATALWEHSPGAAQLALGHTTDKVTQLFYVNGAGILARAVATLPQPEAFTKGREAHYDAMLTA